MRGRSLWRDPPTASACIFCANRMGVPRPRLPSHVQRRFLQTTKPAARPPANAAALREDHDNNDGGNWGLPAFISDTIELTEDERRAAEHISARPVKVFAGPGPESNRGGRHLPKEKTESQARLLAMEKRRNAGLPLFARVPKNIFGDKGSLLLEDENIRTGIARTTEATPTWGSLRRREQSDSTNALEHGQGAFARARVQREQLAKAAKYTPLTNSTIFGSGRLSGAYSQLEPQSNGSKRQARDVVDDHTGWSVSPGRSAIFRGTQAANPPSDMALLDKASNLSGTEPKTSAVEWLDRPAFRTLPVSPPTNRSSRPGRSAPRYGAVELTDQEAQVPSRLRKADEENKVHYKPVSFIAQGRGDSLFSSQSQTTSRQYQPKSFSLQGIRPAPINSAAQSMKIPQEVEAHTPTSSNVAQSLRIEEIQRQEELERDREMRARKRSEKYAAEEAARFERNVVAPRGRSRDKSRRREQFVTELDEVEEDGTAAKAMIKRLRKKEKAARKAAAPTPVFLPEYITIANLALALKVRVEMFVNKMKELGFEETGYDHILNSEDAGLIAQEYNFEPVIDRSESLDLKSRPIPPDPSTLPPRAPVVTIMGHVDHGKTTLLDYLRKSSVAAGEHGGITQHIGAFSVPMPSGKVITFLDTPGHAAFLSMRQRGANVTDIIILVVAADDSVKPQTIEAINHAKNAKVPIIVAINKIDKDEANIERVKQDLARHGVDVEDFGGETQVVCVSGKTGQGMAELEEAAVALSELLDMRADTDGPAEGWVLEASIKSMGKVATVLVRRGTMRPGDFIVAGNTWARIRCLRNEAGVDIKEAGPGMPVEIDGWKEQPLAGDEVLQAPTEQKAKSVVDYRNERDEREKLAEDMEAINDSRRGVQERREAEKQERLLAESDSFEELLAKEEAPGGTKQVHFIIKGDVSGSVEAVIESVSAVGTAEVQARILRSGVGQLSEFDVEHAAAAKGYLINFNTPIDPGISQLAEASKVKIIDHNIIYRLVDDVKAKLSESLPPLVTQRVLGEADVVQVFEISVKGRKHKAVAGCKIRNGVVGKNAKVRVMRVGEKIFDGTLSSLKNVKKDVAEMRKGSECGMGFEGWTDFQVGDQIQSYEVIEEKRYL